MRSEVGYSPHVLRQRERGKKGQTRLYSKLTATENRWPWTFYWCIVAFVTKIINSQAVCLCIAV
jgi:hypothetical protein